MRKIVLTLTAGGDAGNLTETADGKVTGQGRAANLVALAPGKSIDDWMESFGHSKYLSAELEG